MLFLPYHRSFLASLRGRAARTALAVLACLFCYPAVARENPDDLSTLNLYFENDLFSESDQNYTNGIRLSWVSPDLGDYVRDSALPQWIRSVNKRLLFFHPTPKGLQRNVVVSLGQTIFTPEDIDATEVVEDDRPYAGWLFSSFAYHTKTDDQLDSLEVDIGVVGPAALGKEAQDFIHDLRGFEKFKGWDNQLKNEFGLIFAYQHRRRMLEFTASNSDFGYDFIGHAGAAIGNVSTYLNIGGEFRIGWLIPADFGTSAVRTGGDNSSPGAHWDPRYRNDGSWGVHFFASLDGRIVGRDIFLDGNSFHDSHSVRREPVVADLALGFSTVFGGVKLSYAQVLRTREFKKQRDSHSYGSLSISYSF